MREFNKDIPRNLWDGARIPEFFYFTVQEGEGYKDAFVRSYNNASKEDKELVIKLPAFDADVFYKLSGIDLRDNK